MLDKGRIRSLNRRIPNPYQNSKHLVRWRRVLLGKANAGVRFARNIAELPLLRAVP